MRRRATSDVTGDAEAEAESPGPGPKSPAKLKRTVSFGPSEAATGDDGDGAAESPQSHVGRRGSIRPPSILTGAESPFPGLRVACTLARLTVACAALARGSCDAGPDARVGVAQRLTGVRACLGACLAPGALPPRPPRNS